MNESDFEIMSWHDYSFGYYLRTQLAIQNQYHEFRVMAKNSPDKSKHDAIAAKCIAAIEKLNAENAAAQAYYASLNPNFLEANDEESNILRARNEEFLHRVERGYTTPTSPPQSE